MNRKVYNTVSDCIIGNHKVSTFFDNLTKKFFYGFDALIDRTQYAMIIENNGIMTGAINERCNRSMKV